MYIWDKPKSNYEIRYLFEYQQKNPIVYWSQSKVVYTDIFEAPKRYSSLLTMRSTVVAADVIERLQKTCKKSSFR